MAQASCRLPTMRLAELTLLFVFYVSIISISMAIKPQQVWREVNAEEVMEIVEHLAVERIVDTEGHRQVEAYIQNYFATHAPHWTFERDTFSDSTPLGEKTFVNLIATLDARPGELSDKYVVLAAHYDSKIIANTVFEAATDSAVPCAILMHFARHYTAMADSQLLASSQLGHNWGIKLIFFDGEEAFHEWTPVDSIYGSRHLAQEWENDNEKTLLARIDAFILLDLLGAPNMAPIPSRYTATNSKFQFFVNAQTASQQVGRYVIQSKNCSIPLACCHFLAID